MIEIEFPRKLGFLFQPCPYKIAYGGRDGTKSWGFATALIEQGARDKLRILCVRETYTSIESSVHQLLADTVHRLKLDDSYTIQNNTILGRNGTEFIFAGLKHNIDNLKSLEGADRVWVEEAQTVSKQSWDKLLPTIRKPGAEIWVSFNPDLDTDDTYRRWVLDPPAGAKVVKIGWEDNRWLSDISKARIEEMRTKHPTDFDWIYGGNCRSAVEGAIYAAELKLAQEEKRIGSFPVDRTRPVETFWDLGYEDKTAIWFAQPVAGWYHFVDYLENAGKTIEWYLIQLQQRGYVYGKDWLPHDGVDAIIHHRISGNRERSVEQIMRAAGRQVRIVPKMYVLDGINAARSVFSQCRFDESRCYEGLRALRMYQWGPAPASGKLRREPLHDGASHGADGFRGAAITLRQPMVEPTPRARQQIPAGDHSWMG